ncbi:MAG: hypothetical protein GY806_15270 [Gammaproteobacteria bacterium]|nr:hypothetical protein [Gammaproteobacteria bacterium]
MQTLVDRIEESDDSVHDLVNLLSNACPASRINLGAMNCAATERWGNNLT